MRFKPPSAVTCLISRGIDLGIGTASGSQSNRDQCADRTPHQEGQSAKRLPTVRQAGTLGIDALPEQHA
jgi:hypothetical protein